jgi:hypothetical protein
MLSVRSSIKTVYTSRRKQLEEIEYSRPIYYPLKKKPHFSKL